MIGALTGTARGPRLVMTGSGVGYVVSCPDPLEVGQEVDLLVTTVVREDAITLYGFTTEHQQLLFEALTKVSGVGAAIAMAVLGDLGVGAAVKAIREKDTRALSRAKGLGTKTAERVCSMVSLPAALLEVAPEVDEAPGVRSMAATLVAMGYDEAVSTEAARSGLSSAADLAGALRAALAFLRERGEG